MWLIKASLKNAYMVATIVFMIIALGLYAAVHLPEDILPVFKSPAVQVITYYQGMPASSVEKTITNRIERWVNQSPGAARVESKSVPGASVVKIYFRDDIDPNAALTMTNSLALGTLPTLPPNTLPPVVLPFDPTATMPLGILTVSIPGKTEADVKDYARIDVRNMLGAVPGCVAPVVVGGKDRTILIYLKPKEMEARKVSPLDVVGALQKGNLMVTPGTAYFADNQVLLDSNAMVKDVSELNDLPIRIKPGDNVYLRDIGHAEDSSTIQTSRVRIDGQREVYVPIYRQQGASSLSIVDKLKEHIPFMEQRLPAGTQLEFIMDQTESVRETIKELISEGAMGAVLVSLMILLFLGNWRMTVIASTSIPLAVLGATIGLYLTGNTINAMTLGGLALAIGPLVDDAIVELENNHRNYHMGKSRIRAALDGCAEVMVPVMVATCTTMIVLAPLALMPGMGGFLFKPLALAVAFAMITSFVLSRTYVPMMCAKFLPDEHRRGRAPQNGHGPHGDHAEPKGGFFAAFHRRFERLLDGFSRRYATALNWALNHRFIVLGGVFTLFLASLCLVFGIGREFFPAVDAGQITMYVRTPSNLRLDAAEVRVAQVERLIDTVIPGDEREENGLVSEIGLDPDWSVAFTANSGQQDAVIRIQLSNKRRYSSQEYAIRLRDAITKDPQHRFDDLRVTFDTGGMVSTALNEGASSPIDVQVQFSSGGGHTATPPPPPATSSSWWSWLPWAKPAEAPPPPPEPTRPEPLGRAGGGIRRGEAEAGPAGSPPCGCRPGPQDPRPHRHGPGGGGRPGQAAHGRPLPDHRGGPAEGGGRRLVRPRRDSPSGGRHELQRVDQPQLLDRHAIRQPVFRGGPVPREPLGERAGPLKYLRHWHEPAEQRPAVEPHPAGPRHRRRGDHPRKPVPDLRRAGEHGAPRHRRRGRRRHRAAPRPAAKDGLGVHGGGRRLAKPAGRSRRTSRTAASASPTA